MVGAGGGPTITGLHGLVSLLDDLRRFGVPGERTVVVLNRAPRSVRARAELTRVVAALTGAAERPDPSVGPVYVADRRGVDALHHDLGRFPPAVADPPGAGVLAVLDRLGSRTVDADPTVPVPVRPGELGHWGHDGDLHDDLDDELGGGR